ncbi:MULTISPECIES: outer membrane lipid asymmetry maintenance protein MlaD [unclassified Marinobacterium]|uniref:outer membrane lipid asymmetry maintenance protein MlaD n=1 Tax=unclassified Marinobacterium TaxID=2644139 RepID=UPI001569B5DA|nr:MULTISPECIES: outer membrane lipid asymmetry maintenance protein MlaD [unclassified Marinobacterium]NRP09478.1 putative phospholipid ABC transporter-binding protein MlaD [Marinobacterium sp. xm-g-48]NRP26818.1 putative phospholipid ABC transporter-binding protein MlaD [Marinobacterium sp. xm-d-420]NRP58662.1 putative phospholipid ABC transporter-binding protein MlaD [Marinobacterium sp. xm-d-564]NRP81991.1 putative phospholipid ABC transporter-binding protein MlaD [Marinobacterium sp. xm-d-5
MRFRALEISVGALILAGILALVALAINVSGLNLSQKGTGYTVYARFDNIGGLTERAKVSMSGVQIGQVSAIRIDPKRLMAEVEMQIFDDVDYLSIDSSAQILTAGLLGEKYIGITPGFEDDLLENGMTIEDTQSALVLEEIVGKFLFNKVSE